MSHFTALRTHLNNKEALLAALRTLGYQPAVHDQPVQMNGYYDEDEGEPCHIVVPKAQLNTRSDLGFAWSEEGKCYTVVCDWYDINRRNSDLLKFLGDRGFGGKLMVEYTRQTTLMAAQKLGMKTEEKVVDGKLVVTLTPARRAVVSTSVRTTNRVQVRR